ncbi:hypothetical protein [Denitratisoma sp. DHT3]|uniref:hypothetical protein n=1 Tax=Denitratisoma sp. DHT3 TaxID=1981880 RepID=UPI0011A19725|nr:hypothetical protein [Denitratisoma sp. DHT3]
MCKKGNNNDLGRARASKTMKTQLNKLSCHHHLALKSKSRILEIVGLKKSILSLEMEIRRIQDESNYLRSLLARLYACLPEGSLLPTPLLEEIGDVVGYSKSLFK